MQTYLLGEWVVLPHTQPPAPKRQMAYCSHYWGSNWEHDWSLRNTRESLRVKTRDFLRHDLLSSTNRMNTVTDFGQVQFKTCLEVKTLTHRIVTLLFLFVAGPRLALARLLSGKQAVCLQCSGCLYNISCFSVNAVSYT